MVIRTKHILAAFILLCILIGGAVLIYLHLRPTDENRIRALCSTFTANVTKSGKEGAIPAAARAKSLSGLFTDPSHFQIDGLPWGSKPRSREKLSADIFRARAMFKKVTLSFEDLSVLVQDGKAQITLSAVLSGTLNPDKELREIRELEGTLIKKDGEWLFESFRIRKLIRK